MLQVVQSMKEGKTGERIVAVLKLGLSPKHAIG